jgi:hypothetical protein
MPLLTPSTLIITFLTYIGAQVLKLMQTTMVCKYNEKKEKQTLVFYQESESQTHIDHGYPRCNMWFNTFSFGSWAPSVSTKLIGLVSTHATRPRDPRRKI